MPRLPRSLRLLLLAAAVLTIAAPTARAADQAVGTVVSSAPLDPKIWIPDATGQAFRLIYTTTDVHGQPAVSSGELFVPKGEAPAGGWPVISWAHGTSGLADRCAPSLVGPAEPWRDFPYLSRWMKQGYAIVASDYAGLGTPGLPAYLNGLSEAHNVVDMVKAGRAFASAHLLADQQLSNRWVVIGQSQGGGAAIYTARYATEFGGGALDYLGAVGTGVPAYIEDLLTLVAPGVPPVPTGGNLEVYVALILASLRSTHPELGVDGALTPEGKKWVDLTESVCALDEAHQMKSVAIGSMVSKPLASLPGWRPVIEAYMKMPETGYDRPFFMGHGLTDTDVPYATTARYAATLQANGQPVTFKTYPGNHDATLIASQADSIPFVKALFDAAGPGPAPRVRTRMRLIGHPKLARALRKGLRIGVVTDAATPVHLVARRGHAAVGSGRATTANDGTATITVRFRKSARRTLARARRAKLRITSEETALKVVLRR